MQFLEIIILKQLDHPNIMRVYELYQDTKAFYIVCEFYNGGQLNEGIQSNLLIDGNMSISNVMKQLLQAVHYLQSQNIVHRDIKPENIMIQEHNNELLFNYFIILLVY
jgi:calcium-dependent protein kinase